MVATVKVKTVYFVRTESGTVGPFRRRKQAEEAGKGEVAFYRLVRIGRKWRKVW